MKLTQIERQTLVKVGSALEGAMHKVSGYGKYFFDEANFGLKLSYEEMAAFKRAIHKVQGERKMKQLRIQRGSTWYFVDENGRVKTNGWSASEDWVILGATCYNNFGRPMHFITLAGILNGGIDTKAWKYKNGKRKWFIKDLDHGSYREWRSPDYRCWVEENAKES